MALPIEVGALQKCRDACSRERIAKVVGMIGVPAQGMEIERPQRQPRSATAGPANAAVLANMLVIIRTGIFDPPPAGPIAPWPTLGLLLALAAAGVAVSEGVAVARLRRLAVAAELRGL